MPAANKVEAMIPHTHMKLFVELKILPDKLASASAFAIYYGKWAAYIYFF
jgi:hypothetical protein